MYAVSNPTSLELAARPRNLYARRRRRQLHNVRPGHFGRQEKQQSVFAVQLNRNKSRAERQSQEHARMFYRYEIIIKSIRGYYSRYQSIKHRGVERVLYRRYYKNKSMSDKRQTNGYRP